MSKRHDIILVPVKTQETTVVHLGDATREKKGVVQVGTSEFLTIVDGVLDFKDSNFLPSSSLDSHLNDPEAHNIPAQIDNKIEEHDSSGVLQSDGTWTDRPHENIYSRVDEQIVNLQSTDYSQNQRLTDLEIFESGIDNTIQTKIEAYGEKFTQEEKTKLTEIELGAQVNVLESVKSGGVALPISEKSVDIKNTIDTIVASAIAELIGDSPETLDTLEEIADALNNNHDFYNTITSMIQEKLDAKFSGYSLESEYDSNDLIVLNDSADKVYTLKVSNLLEGYFKEEDFKEKLPKDIVTFDIESIDSIDVPTIKTTVADFLKQEEGVYKSASELKVGDSDKLNGKLENELEVESANKAYYLKQGFDNEGEPVFVQASALEVNIANYATKALQDNEGNKIHTTYAKKSDFEKRKEWFVVREEDVAGEGIYDSSSFPNWAVFYIDDFAFENYKKLKIYFSLDINWNKGCNFSDTPQHIESFIILNDSYIQTSPILHTLPVSGVPIYSGYGGSQNVILQVPFGITRYDSGDKGFNIIITTSNAIMGQPKTSGYAFLYSNSDWPNEGFQKNDVVNITDFKIHKVEALLDFDYEEQESD